jgi:abhydrolase domain-containing protein 17
VEISPSENLTLTSYILETRVHNKIASIFIEIQASKVDYVLLFSHGNQTDIGYMLDTYLGIILSTITLDLAYNFNINVLAYEYSGYG